MLHKAGCVERIPGYPATCELSLQKPPANQYARESQKREVHSPTPQTRPLQGFFSSLLGPVVANEISERLDIVKAEIFRLTAQIAHSDWIGREKRDRSRQTGLSSIGALSPYRSSRGFRSIERRFLELGANYRQHGTFAHLGPIPRKGSIADKPSGTASTHRDVDFQNTD